MARAKADRDLAAEYAAGSITLDELNAAASEAATAATTAGESGELAPVTTGDVPT